MKNWLVPLSLITATSAAAQSLPGPMPTVAPNPQYMWQSHDITDGSPNVGRYASVAQTETTCSAPHGTFGTIYYTCPLIGVAYYDVTNMDLVYAWSTDGGETFQRVTVDRRNGDDIGHYPALAYNGDEPVIAYRNATTGRLLLATRTAVVGVGNCGGDDWSCRNIGVDGLHNAIAMHSDGRLVIAYYDTAFGIRVKEAPYPYSTFTTRDVANSTPRSIAVAVDDIGQVHVAWVSSSCVRYSYGYFEDDESVECGDALPVPGAGGVDLMLNQFRRPHIAYNQYSAANGHRIRRVYKSDHQTWQRETVASLTAAPQPGMSILAREDLSGVDAIAWGVAPSGLRVAKPATQTPWHVASGSFNGGAYANLMPYGTGRAVIHYDSARTRLMFTDDN